MRGLLGQPVPHPSSFAHRDAQSGFVWSDPPDEEKRALLHELGAMAAACGMALRVCSQKTYLGEGIGEARCVDAERLMSLTGQRFASELKALRGLAPITSGGA